MKIISKILCPAVVFTLSVLNPVSADACAYLMQPHYILTKGNAYTPSLQKGYAFKYFIETSGDLFKDTPVYKDGLEAQDADKKDFSDALKKYCPKMPEAEQKKLLETYLNFREDFRAGLVSAKKDFPAIPAEMEEFRLYYLGKEELVKTPEKAESWEKLLTLPPERRHFRTTWILYLKGNLDKANIHARAAEVRKAIDAGFADSQGLGWGSYKQEMRYGTDPVKTIRAAVEAQRGAMDHNMIKYLSYYNRKFCIRGDLFAELTEKEYQALLADPVCREIVLIYENDVKKLIARSANLKFRCIDILAFRAWENGDVKQTETYLAMLEKPTLLSVYVESELARYHGSVDLAAKKLRQWLKMAEKVSPLTDMKLLNRGADEDFYRFIIPDDWKSEIYGILGYTMVLKRNFMDAARFFYESGQGESDLPYIAERFLTLEQLVEFVDSISEDANIKDERSCKPHMVKMMRHLTARRAFREEKFDIAKKYMPDDYKGYMKQYLEFLAIGRDTKKGANERGIALYNAAKIMRYKGLELCGTETDPDNFRHNGNFTLVENRYHPSCKKCKYDRHLGSWYFCKEHYNNGEWKPGLNAAKNYLTVPAYQRWHYRYRAADLLLEAGDIAQDPELLALINYFGGECLRKTSPYEADVFYKRLVNQSRHTKFGKLADELRWFPYYIVPLRKEVHRIDPIASLDAVKQLMKEAFPEKKNADMKK